VSARTEALEARIGADASGFDPTALLALLDHLGHRPEEILFESAIGDVSQPALLNRVAFERAQVTVTLNMGLLGTQSLLPSYFKRILEDSDIDDESFVDFLRFFDHRLLEGWLQSLAPERDKKIFRDFERTKASYLRLLGLRSSSTMHWLVALVYPELGVRVDRSLMKRLVTLEGARLGHAVLGGGAVLGGRARAPVPGFLITLYADEEHTEAGRPWAEEVRRRLDSLVFPAVAQAALELKVVLVIRSEKVWARLGPGSYLGFDRVKGGMRRNREIQVFNGRVGAA
jgi:predicted component of type VI protein secretion system